ncbi:MAG: hypothetical protein MAG794_01044 [Gammaproteobacteria bacterium]|nr:hypothetical protein [Gammaproteobacteria bacterium]
MKKIAAILSIAIAIAVGAAYLYLRHGYVYEISQAEIQNRIDSQFPVENCVLVFCIELSEPFVLLRDQQTRIEFGSNALMEIAFSNEQYDGSVGFSGEVSYKPGKRALYLERSRLEHLDFSGVSDKDKQNQNLNRLAVLLVSEYLRANPIYSFHDTVFALIAPWLQLKEVYVRDGILRLRLALAT